MEPGVIVNDPVQDEDSGFFGWFDFQPDSGRGTKTLNGQRICTIAYAQRRGFRDAG